MKIKQILKNYNNLFSNLWKPYFSVETKHPFYLIIFVFITIFVTEEYLMAHFFKILNFIPRFTKLVYCAKCIPYFTVMFDGILNCLLMSLQHLFLHHLGKEYFIFVQIFTSSSILTSIVFIIISKICFKIILYFLLRNSSV